MNPYAHFYDLLFTCVNGSVTAVAAEVLRAFNGGNSANPCYFLRETALDFNLAYIDQSERDASQPHRIIFWEPRLHQGKTAMMGRFHDGLTYSVQRLSQGSPFCWINVRIYDDDDYPGCFFDYYDSRLQIERQLMACEDEQGWEFSQHGPVQSFENPSYYAAQLECDRLNKAIVTEYLKKLDYDIAMSDFWETDIPAMLLWQAK